MRVCLDCHRLIPAGTRDGRCDEHRKAKDRARGTRQARGYDANHDAERARWAPLVATGNVKCARCRQHIAPADAWDLDHTAKRDGYLGPSHASCNRAAH